MAQPPQLVRVCSPELVSDGLASSHHTYLVELTGDGVICGSARRRFSDFDLLARTLSARYVGLVLPPLPLCADNGAMIAGLGAIQLRRGDLSPLDLDAVARVEGAASGTRPDAGVGRGGDDAGRRRRFDGAHGAAWHSDWRVRRHRCERV